MFNFLKSLAIEGRVAGGTYNKITQESVLNALNPFHGSSNIDDLFKFIMMIIRIILSFGGLIGIAFVIYGGYQYITSGGSPENTKKATSTITWAIIGTILAFTATILIDFIITEGLKIS